MQESISETQERVKHDLPTVLSVSHISYCKHLFYIIERLYKCHPTKKGLQLATVPSVRHVPYCSISFTY